MMTTRTVLAALMEAMTHVENVVSVERDSKHARGHRRPGGWHQKLRAKRKAKRAARRAHRGH